MTRLSSHTNKGHPQAAPDDHHRGQCRSTTAPSSGRVSFNTREGLSFTAYSPLAGGWLARRYRAAGEPYPRDSRMALRPDPYEHLVNDATFAALDALRQQATDRRVALPALALAWVLSDPAVSVVVVGPRRPDQLAPALAALDLPLSPAQRADLTRIMPA